MLSSPLGHSRRTYPTSVETSSTTAVSLLQITMVIEDTSIAAKLHESYLAHIIGVGWHIKSFFSKHLIKSVHRGITIAKDCVSIERVSRMLSPRQSISLRSVVLIRALQSFLFINYQSMSLHSSVFFLIEEKNNQPWWFRLTHTRNRREMPNGKLWCLLSSVRNATESMNRIRHATIAAILCLQTICRCVISTVGQYIYASYLQIYPFSSNDTDPSSTIASTTLSQFHTQVNSCPTNTSSGNAQLWAQEQSADLFFRIDLWNSCPMIVMTLLLGIYTPKLGRRFVLLLPMLGTICQLAIWLTIIYARLGDKWWYLASFLVGLSGSNNVLSRSDQSSRSRLIFFLSI